MAGYRDIVVGTYPDATFAHVAQMRLDSEGIESRIEDENFASVYPLYAGTMGGVKLVVREDDASEALRIIEEGDADKRASQEDVQLHCPECGSVKVRASDFGMLRVLLLTVLTAGLFLPFFYRGHRCVDCGHRW